jgi:hypothetical protein
MLTFREWLTWVRRKIKRVKRENHMLNLMTKTMMITSKKRMRKTRMNLMISRKSLI